MIAALVVLGTLTVVVMCSVVVCSVVVVGLVGSGTAAVVGTVVVVRSVVVGGSVVVVVVTGCKVVGGSGNGLVMGDVVVRGAMVELLGNGHPSSSSPSGQLAVPSQSCTSQISLEPPRQVNLMSPRHSSTGASNVGNVGAPIYLKCELCRIK